MAGVAGHTLPLREDGVENALGWETPYSLQAVRPSLSCLVSPSLSLPICKVNFLPALNFSGSVAPLAEHWERAGGGRLRVGQILGALREEKHKENH